MPTGTGSRVAITEHILGIKLSRKAKKPNIHAKSTPRSDRVNPTNKPAYNVIMPNIKKKKGKVKEPVAAVNKATANDDPDIIIKILKAFLS